MSKENQQTGVVKTEQFTQAERFTKEVLRQFASSAGQIQVTEFQKKLAQNYFIKLDASLREAERKRMAKDEKYRDATPVTWENVNMQKLAQEVVAYTSVGLDPLQPNHINLIPYKNNGTHKYDIGFVMGYRGIELKAKKYGFEVPDDIIIELVYSTDTFKQFKKDKDNKIESYTFIVNEDFDRGEIVGGFYYFVYNDNPEKNKLRVMPIKEILKHKPEYASAEFWGGEKDVWKTVEGKRTKTTEQTEGWYDQMCWKTVARAAYNSITIDSAKIDEHLMAVIQLEQESRENPTVKQEIQENANKQSIGFETEDQEATIVSIETAKTETEQKSEENQGAENTGDKTQTQLEIPSEENQATNTKEKGPGF